jgi:hypothetical protein
MLCIKCSKNERAASHSWCLPCKRAYDKDWYAANGEHRRANMRERHRADPRAKMLAAAKKRAAEKGIEFTLTRGSVTVPAVCPVLGIELKVTGQRWQDNSPSIDRVDPKRGYVEGNVMVISSRANRIKNDATADELDKIAAYIRAAT